MVNVVPALCDKCGDIILLKEGMPFVRCKECGESVEVHDSLQAFVEIVKDVSKRQSIVNNAIKQYKADKKSAYAFCVLNYLSGLYPLDEVIAFWVLKISGFTRENTAVYLNRFCNDTTPFSYSDEFLSMCLNLQNISLYEKFEKYINNKIENNKRRTDWLIRLGDLKVSWVKSANGKASFIVNIVILITCCIVSMVGCVGMFTFLSHFNFYIICAITFAVVMGQYGLIFLHKQMFGNRTEVTLLEKNLIMAMGCLGLIFIGSTFISLLINMII